jgi:hypothetical protein
MSRSFKSKGLNSAGRRIQALGVDTTGYSYKVQFTQWAQMQQMLRA